MPEPAAEADALGPLPEEGWTAAKFIATPPDPIGVPNRERFDPRAALRRGAAVVVAARERVAQLAKFESATAVRAFFAECDSIPSPGRELDWDEQLALIDRSRRSDSSDRRYLRTLTCSCTRLAVRIHCENLRENFSSSLTTNTRSLGRYLECCKTCCTSCNLAED